MYFAPYLNNAVLCVFIYMKEMILKDCFNFVKDDIEYHKKCETRKNKNA